MLCGSIGKALEIQNEANSYEQVDILFSTLEQKDIIDVWNAGSILYSSKDTIYHLLDYINIVLVQKLKDTKDMKYVRMVQIVEQTKKRLTSNANYDMAIDNLLLNMWEEIHEKYSGN